MLCDVLWPAAKSRPPVGPEDDERNEIRGASRNAW
jgi:hypothetical protein